MTHDPLVGLTKAQRDYVTRIEHNTIGLTAVSTGACPGCEQCRDTYGVGVRCECQDEPENEGEPDPGCDLCDGKGERPPTMAEFHDQWSHGELIVEARFSRWGCDVCGSPLGGDMEPWHGVDHTGEIFHGENACADCACYLANGDLPEND